MAFKYGLNTHKHNIIGIFKYLGKLFKGWKPNPLATGSPVLKKIKINDLAPVVTQLDGLGLMAITINPVG